MGFLDKIQEGVNKGIGETDRLLELGKLKSRRSQLQKDRDGLLTIAGRTVYSVSRQRDVGIPELSEVLGSINSVELQIVGLDDQIAELERGSSGTGTACASCGAMNPAGAQFCVSCGSELKAQQTGPVCANCGGVLPENSQFCVRCGTRVEQVSAEEPAVAMQPDADAGDEAPAPMPEQAPDGSTTE